MPTIASLKTFNGTETKLNRLGLRPLWEELKEILTGFHLNIQERLHANSAVHTRHVLEHRFEMVTGWSRRRTGELYWSKHLTKNNSRVCLGVKIRIAGRHDLSPQDLLIMEIVGLSQQLIRGSIDIAALVVPSAQFSVYLGNRAPNLVDAIRAVERTRATDLPLIILALEHDGPGRPLPKKRTRQGRAET